MMSLAGIRKGGGGGGGWSGTGGRRGWKNPLLISPVLKAMISFIDVQYYLTSA